MFKLLPDDQYCKTCQYPLRPGPWGPCEMCYERAKADAKTLQTWKEMMGGEKAWVEYTKDRYVLTAFNSHAFAGASTWDHRKGSLLLMGPKGTGKSHLAAIVKRPLVMSGTLVRTVFMQEELDAARQDLKRKDQAKDRISSMISVPVLSIEDLGVEKASEWVVNEWYYKIVDGRYRARKHGLIITMNQTLDELEYYWMRFDPHGRVVSRLKEMCRGHIYDFRGEKDWRSE